MSQCVHACSDTMLCPTLLWFHGLQHARFPCPSLSSTFWSNSWPFSQWRCLTISSSATLFSFCLQSSPASRSFPMSRLFTSDGQSIGFTISLFNEYSRRISFSIDWFDLLAVQGTLKIFSSTMIWDYQFFSLLYGPTLTFIHDYWKNYSFNCMDLCWQSVVSAF